MTCVHPSIAQTEPAPPHLSHIVTEGEILHLELVKGSLFYLVLFWLNSLKELLVVVISSNSDC